MITVDLHIQQDLAKLHRLQRTQIKISQTIQHLAAVRISDLQITSVGIQELIFNGIQCHGILGIAVGDIIVVILYGDIADSKSLLLLHRFIMDTNEVFQESLQRTLIGKRRLNGILQIGKAGLTMKQIMKLSTLFLTLTLFFYLMTGCGNSSSDSGSEGDKIKATAILVLEDKTEVKYDLNVSADKTIRETLYEAELISEDTMYAMFVDNIDGHVADAMKDGVTWVSCDMDGNQIPVEGEVVSAFDSYKLKDGDSIKIVYTIVPNFDD